MKKNIYGNPLLNDIRRIDTVRPQEVLVVECIKGEGTDVEPIIAYLQFWTREGVFIGEIPK